jgi:hypothetical protein
MFLIDRESGKEGLLDLPVSTPKTGRERLKSVMQTARVLSVLNGTDNITMDEIDFEIAEARKEMQLKK